MTAITFKEQVIIRKHVYDYLESHQVISLRRIIGYVLREANVETSTTTIARLIREYGYEYNGEKWIKA